MAEIIVHRIMSCAAAPVSLPLPAAILYAASRTSFPLPYQHTDIPYLLTMSLLTHKKPSGCFVVGGRAIFRE